jgi:hypothetical protein
MNQYSNIRIYKGVNTVHIVSILFGGPVEKEGLRCTVFFQTSNPFSCVNF